MANGDVGEGSHGTATLSVLGGFRPGQIIGPAYAASFILAKTENTESETPVEEDNWAAAVEWAESLGADVISSSLGYLTYDRPFPSYTAADMDGDTAISTRAADLAGERGVMVVNSAGNEGLNTSANTLGAPADGDLVLAVGAVSSVGSARVVQLRRALGRRPHQARRRGAGRGGQDRAPRLGDRLHHRQRDVVLVPAHRGRGRAPGPGQPLGHGRTRSSARCAARPASPPARQPARLRHRRRAGRAARRGPSRLPSAGRQLPYGPWRASRRTKAINSPSVGPRTLTDVDCQGDRRPRRGRARDHRRPINHLVALERALDVACGFKSLFGYCRRVLRCSEAASTTACSAAHAARRFPVVLPMLAEGLLHLTAVRLLWPCLKDQENFYNKFEFATGASDEH